MCRWSYGGGIGNCLDTAGSVVADLELLARRMDQAGEESIRIAASDAIAIGILT